MPFRGGAFHYGAIAGVFALYLHYPRSDSSPTVGFRSALLSSSGDKLLRYFIQYREIKGAFSLTLW